MWDLPGRRGDARRSGQRRLTVSKSTSKGSIRKNGIQGTKGQIFLPTRGTHEPAMSMTVIDSGYMDLERHTAAYLVCDEGRAAFVETNTNRAVPRFIEALEAKGLGPDVVDYVIITHVHLDHAGGASALMDLCPNATLVAHPRAAPHIIDPSRLVASSKKVYGEEVFQRIYGDIRPVAEDRVRIMQDRDRLAFGSRELTFIDTRGHANHHFVIHDSKTHGVFTGDAFGIAYPDLQAHGLLVFPSATPTDFDAEEAKRSLDLIVGTGAERVYLTHYGERHDLEAMAAMLHEQLDTYKAVVDELFSMDLEDEALDEAVDVRVRASFESLLRGSPLESDSAVRSLIENDIELNGKGLAFAVRKRRFKARA